MSVAQSPPYQRTDYGLPWISSFFSEVVNLVPTLTAFNATSLHVVAGRAAVVLGNDSSLALLLVPRALLYQAMDYSERTTCRVYVVWNHEHGGVSRKCSNCSTSSPSFHTTFFQLRSPQYASPNEYSYSWFSPFPKPQYMSGSWCVIALRRLLSWHFYSM